MMVAGIMIGLLITPLFFVFVQNRKSKKSMQKWVKNGIEHKYLEEKEEKSLVD